MRRRAPLVVCLPLLVSGTALADDPAGRPVVGFSSTVAYASSSRAGQGELLRLEGVTGREPRGSGFVALFTPAAASLLLARDGWAYSNGVSFLAGVSTPRVFVLAGGGFEVGLDRVRGETGLVPFAPAARAVAGLHVAGVHVGLDAAAERRFSVFAPHHTVLSAGLLIGFSREGVYRG